MPSFPPVLDFIELNLRTYVIRNNKPGTYFLSLEAGNTISAAVVRLVTGLNYYESVIHHHTGFYESENLGRLSYLKAAYNQGRSIDEKNLNDRWLTDRFCLFREISGEVYSNDIHHRDWPLKRVDIVSLEVNYRFGDLLIDSNPNLSHYSDGVQVEVWGKKKV
jgi:uncharacterized protein YqjF (DUF2071 family)